MLPGMAAFPALSQGLGMFPIGVVDTSPNFGQPTLTLGYHDPIASYLTFVSRATPPSDWAEEFKPGTSLFAVTAAAALTLAAQNYTDRYFSAQLNTGVTTTEFLSWIPSGIITDGEVLVGINLTRLVTGFNIRNVPLVFRLQQGSPGCYAVELASNQVQLMYISTSGTVTTLASSTVANRIPISTWYWIRANFQGSTLKVKWWADGVAEPAAWILTVTDAHYASGKVGIAASPDTTSGGSAPIYYSSISVGIGVNSAPLPASAFTVIPGQLLAANFDMLADSMDSPDLLLGGGLGTVNPIPSYVIGTNLPPSWTEEWNAGNASFSVSLTSAAANRNLPTQHYSDRVFSLSTTSRTAPDELISWNTAGVLANGEVLVLAATDDASVASHMLTFRGQAGSEAAYAIYVTGGGGGIHNLPSSVQLVSITGAGQQSNIGAISGGISSQTWYWIRVNFQGSALKVKIWADGTAEPATWGLSVTNTTYTTGKVSLRAQQTNKFYTAITLGVGSNTAPTPPANF